MAFPVAVVFADSHLRRRIWANRPIEGDSYFSFQQIVDAAIELNAPLVGAGDLIDQRINESGPIVFLQRQMDLLHKHGVRFYYLQGQHEMDLVPWCSLGGALTTHIHGQCFMLGDFPCYGIDYQPAVKLQEELERIPSDRQILFAHQVWRNFMGSIASPQGEFSDIPYVTTMVTGDFHETVLANAKNKQQADLKVFSPGSTCLQEISEPSNKYYGVLCSDGAIRKKRLKTRRRLDLGPLITEEEVEQLLTGLEEKLEQALQSAADDQLPDELRTPLCRVTYSHTMNDAPRRILRLANGRAHLFWKELPKHQELTSAGRNAVEQITNNVAETNDPLMAAIASELNPVDDPKAYRLALRVLGCEPANVAQELKTWLEENLATEATQE